MRFVYTTHARLRMRQRSIGVRQVEAAIRAPDRVLPSFGNREIVQRLFGQRRLEVVYRRRGERTIVITAYWLTGGS